MRGFVESSSSETLARSLTTIKERQGLVLVADWDGEVAGVLAFQIIPLFHIAGDLGRITALVVSSRLERRGIGRRLVADVRVPDVGFDVRTYPHVTAFGIGDAFIEMMIFHRFRQLSIGEEQIVKLLMDIRKTRAIRSVTEDSA
jgi:N-acetylglutamate synthase-like GNAT family acetyltransferase